MNAELIFFRRFTICYNGDTMKNQVPLECINRACKYQHVCTIHTSIIEKWKKKKRLNIQTIVCFQFANKKLRKL